MPEITGVAAVTVSMFSALAKWAAGLFAGAALLIFGRSMAWVIRINRETQEARDIEAARARYEEKRDTETALFRHEMIAWLKKLDEQIEILARAEAARVAVEADRKTRH
jgi:hypothetical protein